MTPTIKDVAEMAGVSQSTVSLVINDRVNVAPETRKRVKSAIEELNYHPRHAARHLAIRRGGSIGFVMTEQFFTVSEQFYTRILLAAEFEAAKLGYYTLIGRITKKFDPKRGIPRFLLDGSVDGVIVAGKAPAGLLKYIKERGLSLVVVDFKVPSVRTNLILIDNLNGAREAISHLVETGHSHIGFVGGDSEHPSIRERFKGFEEVISEMNGGLPDDFDNYVYLVPEESSPAVGKAGTMKLMQQENPPTAIFAVNDSTGVGVYRMLKELGLSIPDDVSVVGFDDVEIGLHLEPALSTVHIFKAQMGQEAVRTLVDNIEEPEEPYRTKILSTRLVIRGSSGGERTKKADFS